MVYCFRYVPTGVQPPRAPIKRPPACRALLNATAACRCGFICPLQMKGTESTKHHFKANGQHQDLEGKDKQLVVAELYKRFLSEVSGRHVGRMFSSVRMCVCGCLQLSHVALSQCESESS